MTFVWTSTTLVLTVLVMAVAAVCCVVSWQRSGYSRTIVWLELFRFALIAIVLMTLNQPEFIQETKPKEQPTLVVMHDTSGSMQTRDVVRPQSLAEKPKKRSEVVAAAVLPEVWQAVADRMQVVLEPFSSQLPKPDRGTDLNSALQMVADKHANLRGVVLLSDGDWNTGIPPTTAAAALRSKNVPVFAVGVGSAERLPDVEISASDAPTFGVAGKTLRIPFRVVSWLPADRDIKVVLTGTRGDKIEKTVRVAGMGGGSGRRSRNGRREQQIDHPDNGPRRSAQGADCRIVSSLGISLPAKCPRTRSGRQSELLAISSGPRRGRWRARLSRAVSIGEGVVRL
jgi:hypothetical protein